ncbi:MAG: exopolysaccharide biosynthesis protein [Gemmatimonadetes bacterium]|nr:exopolysaccharide biosynthesis protein [Gemmatimonadota bacterium]MCA9763856.1 exopolysaccharide biosynthesis protein [Gemmatimonadota bacterium]MCB9518480.1 exopolysaccharide biosynthesis protein [Gemmatimonadales bacterium]HPF61370.1 exopolysaccharide biosynthesis protein [Gemmatimonadales bacterium]HRX19897.1 exopolysaccharide biosynthesis protein [Gemmatimonadales bacterium]
MPSTPSSLTDVLDRIESAADDQSTVSFEEILDAVGRRSFGPLLVLAGLVILAPVVGDIPGVPTVVAVFVALVALQLVIGRTRFWLPQWMLDLSIESRRLDKPLRWLRKPSGFLDSLFTKRWDALTREPVLRLVAGACLAVSVVMPALELIPFSTNAGGVVLLCFGLAMIVRDGVMVLVGMLATAGALAIVAMAVV